MGIQTRKITVSGLVQGIGFRPFVAELAEELQLAGQVKNLGGVVEINIQGNKQAVDTFIHRLNLVSENGELPGCRIDSLEVEDVSEYDDSQMHEFERFQIVESGSTRELRRFLPVDLPTCDRCVAEMHDPKNRRYRYPFISCTACGPRFSIQKAVPYDRETITMDEFQMCDACYEEYTQKGNIRRHAQTIACQECGPELKYVACADAEKVTVEQKITGEASKILTEITNQHQAIAQAITDLKNGKIGAIKDIGGFHFAFSPMNSDAAMRLRDFKNRDKKPFAVMFLNVDLIKEYCEVLEEEQQLLESSARPIVLLKKKKDFVPEICGESDRIGALLPCNPLQILLLEETGPLVMTSGNRGGEPIIISDEEMIKHLGNGIDFMLTHNREILTSLDDSIYQVVVQGADIGGDLEKSYDAKEKSSYIQLLRRARGLVPEPIVMKRSLSKDVFAAGGDLKASFAFGRDELVYLSQYFGDLDDVRCMESRRQGKVRMEQLLDIHPERSVCDMHPGYVSVQEALTEVQREKVHEGLHQIQHHHAHVASVIAEHGLEGKILGIACDGTGYGTDGTIWGSEFLLCEEEKMTRLGHFSAVKLLGGDASAKQADLTLFCYMLEARERNLEVEAYFEKLVKMGAHETDSSVTSKSMPQNYMLQEAAWKQNINTVYSSSMGRLFDATAALLDICHYNSYEGECAIKLEQAAHQGKIAYENEHFAHNSEENIDNILHVECVKIDGIWQANGVKLLVDMYHLREKYSKEVLAYAFHQAVATAIVELAEKICKEQSLSGKAVNQVALSGGTFLNRILTSAIVRRLQEMGKDVYLNEKVPCGDGGIALGQMYLATFEK
ncbi:MAG: carbamoyltransferase HypF [Lachnospiraceae bacterium]|nr:carbamoyltransferase HypF [Lachnospiraceae bacterium]